MMDYFFGGIENMMREGENACHNRVLLFLSCFPKSSSAAGKGINPAHHNLFYLLQWQRGTKTIEKEEFGSYKGISYSVCYNILN